MSATRDVTLMSAGKLDPRWVWAHEPGTWSVDGSAGAVVLRTESKTDFWQRTHYGFRADNGHFLSTSMTGNGKITARIHLSPAHQYDQAGLMVRLSEDCWLKTSVEFEPEGESQLGAVVTNGGYSDWSTQAWSGDSFDFWLSIEREGSCYIVHWSPTGEHWKQLRVATLHEDDGVRPVRVGIYACSPKEGGCECQFGEVRLQSSPH